MNSYLKNKENNQFILITGVAGFIGYHVCNKLLEKGYNCIGIDNINNYYDIDLKKERLKKLKKLKRFKFLKIDISKKKDFIKLEKYKFNIVINLAAQAGVRYAFKKPEVYIKSNIIGFNNLLNFIKLKKIKKLIFASTSSVYGDIVQFPWSEKQNANKPLTIYSSSKIFNENLAYGFSRYNNTKCLGLRFFTVYGNYGRPDMSIYKFTKNILENKEITIFNKGNHSRDFTHVDVVKDIIYQLTFEKKWKNIFHNKKFEILNIAGGHKIKLLKLIELIEKYCKKKAVRKYVGMQDGDIKETEASLHKLKKYKLLKKKVKIETGIKKFVMWYKNYVH
jgi:UDP-glucuronate 4-epimerase